MKQVTAYRCEHCGKVYLTQYHCRKHEPLCTQNPQTRPLCYSCQNYNMAGPDEWMFVEIPDGGYNNPFEDTTRLKFDLNTCEARKSDPDGNFLFNKRKQTPETLTALKRDGFIPMPSKSSGGCKNYKPIEGHPYVDNPKKLNEQ